MSGTFQTSLPVRPEFHESRSIAVKAAAKRVISRHRRLLRFSRGVYRLCTGFYIRETLRFIEILRHVFFAHEVRARTDQLKRRRILELCEESYTTIIETGTFLGESTRFFASHFQQVYTIEVSDMLYARARDKLAQLANVEVLHGDSGVVLESLMTRIDSPCVIYLDGHYSGGVTSQGSKKVPIYEELHHIFCHPVKNHLVVIDDARCFIGRDGYPRLGELLEFIRTEAGDDHYKMSIDGDFIVLTEPGLPPSQWAELAESQ